MTTGKALGSIDWQNIRVRLGDLKPWSDNPRCSTKAQAERILKSFDEFGQVETIAVSPALDVYNGHQRLSALVTLHGADYEVDARQCSRLLTDEERKRLTVYLHAGAVGSWDWDTISSWSAPELIAWGMDDPVLRDWKRDVTALSELLGSESIDGNYEHTTLAERFIVPPFSVLDARQGYWQERKRVWISLGIKSEVGRGDLLTCPGEQITEDGLNYYRNREKNNGLLGESEQSRTHYSGREVATSYSSQQRLTALQKTGDSRAVDYGTAGNVSEQSGTSIFDPVLCELAYRWFMPVGGSVLDPFAGGSVRGIVASILGHEYTGIDLSKRQIEANIEQGKLITPAKQPKWIVGDSKNVKELAPGEYDFIFSCPPYADLEVYSDDPNDLSTMDYTEFKTAYHEIVSKSVSMLKDNRFACFCVGDVRDKKGFYRNFVSNTIDAFQDAGMKLYNEAILVTAVGSLPIRAGRAFQSGRKLGKTHQNVLVFYKGDPKLIREFGDVECGDVEQVTE